MRTVWSIRRTQGRRTSGFVCTIRRLLELQEFKRALEASPARGMLPAETAISLESNPDALLLETTA